MAKPETSPVYLALDLWMALGLPASMFDDYYERNGWANTWSNLLGVARNFSGREDCLDIVDAERCQMSSGHIGPHMGQSDLGYSEPLPIGAYRG